MSDYDPSAYPPFAVTVDVVVFTIVDDVLQVVLVRRGEPPFKDRWALPGGFVREDEAPREAARRELAEETKLGLKPDKLEQLRTYGEPDRDPRMRVVTVAYWTIQADVGDLAGGGDAAEAALVPVVEIEREERKLAFDHRTIVLDAVDRARSRLEYSTEASRFCPPEFTIRQLRRVYEAVWGTEFDQGNFQRKVRSEPDFVRDLGRTTDPSGSRGRPAALFSAGEVSRLEQPFLAMRSESRAMPPPRSRPSDDYPSWLVESENQEPDEQAGEKE
ncbi:MAG: NUDIX hydrolase [Actinomycetia bacterium]|nr:NUDIX hydrolase [Actinomycetes bacterium]